MHVDDVVPNRPQHRAQHIVKLLVGNKRGPLRCLFFLYIIRRLTATQFDNIAVFHRKLAFHCLIVVSSHSVIIASTSSGLKASRIVICSSPIFRSASSTLLDIEDIARNFFSKSFLSIPNSR